MPTKAELMTFMKKYKKENCKSISTMSKAELEKEAISNGFLHEKHGLKKKTKTPMASAPASAPAPKASAPKASAPKDLIMIKREIFEKIRELDKKDTTKMNSEDAKVVNKQRLKLFSDLKNAKA
jgi:hypothetical protein